MRTWTSGQSVKRKVRSTIPNRELEVTLSAAGPVEVSPEALTFNASTAERVFSIRAKHESNYQPGLTGWFENGPAQVGTITLSTHLKSGQVIVSQPVPVVIELQPVWKRVACAAGTVTILLSSLFCIVRGRRLPKWLLVPSDATGHPVRGAEPIRLSVYHRSLDLAQFGMPGAVLYKSIGGRVGVRLRGGVHVQAAGTATPSDLAHSSLDSRVGIGDRLHYRKPDGTNLIYTIDAF
jgi:hypothetical protein